ncbi:biotin carboxylase N-terminal domain-containing protein, partial [Pseudacidovorax intermedius]
MSGPVTEKGGALGALRRVLVANRGEIAVRIVHACHALGLEAVVAVSDADVGGLAS